MDIGFDVSGAVSGVSQLSEGMSGRLMAVLLIAVIGLVGRQVFVAFGANLKLGNPLRDFSGVARLMVGGFMVFGVLILVGKPDTFLRTIQRNVTDPFLISVLDRDSCDAASGKYCVIVFEPDREISVNWHDKRVVMWDIAHPMQGAVHRSPRPRIRVSAPVPTPVPSTI